ncbi:accessory Sec system S-layer assembly protein [Sporosarcina thermotolerans]|uniref:Accessory Sec system S-layer assembly protein n=1 Tax=Sporosarcina thermotolerans TaxID=633404 RepID=A0AAW9A9N5_9BACL|nr:accessory Sec system S-layer assembly protein [Sporosarcina thermotolerans]MDW0116899.1 accessory Sec system S-layer assembly protein [Sporosarcina thermotolerans]WHT47977.1 accessory Sec system S-layer assembly protein [Sporosarcina thermotolerans]
MKLFSMFKKTEKTGADSTVNSGEILENAVQSDETDDIETQLSFHPEWALSQEQEYVFRFLSNELEPLKPNQISLAGVDIDVEKADGSWLVKAFFRSSLDQAISMGPVELLLLDDKGEVIASQEFNLSELGEIQARSARPWVFVFTKQNTFMEEPPKENWKLAFNVQSMVPHKLELEQAWEDGLSAEQKDALEKVVERMPKLKPREVNFAGFQVKKQDDGSIAVSLFIRNGHSKQISIEKLPLELLDATGDLVARGSFNLSPLEVKANTSKPWTFIYPKEMVQKEDPDFTKWVIRVPEQ